MLGSYVCYTKPNKEWSCDLLFGKGLLVLDNMKLPDTELHGMVTGSNVQIIVVNGLGDWVEELASFCNSEITLSWMCYEQVKLITFVRNRVTAMRSTIGLDTLYHVDGKFNPADVGTRPDKITIDSVSQVLFGSRYTLGYEDHLRMSGGMEL